jgi:ubiquinone/menaquinone biosynthesis C-methylase UbiE
MASEPPTNRYLNFDAGTVEGFGAEWSRFDQSDSSATDYTVVFNAYFRLLPDDFFSRELIAVDVGCGSGRWARLVAPKVKHLVCADASQSALAVARRNLAGHYNVEFCECSVANLPLSENFADLVFSLGVLHHVPDTQAGIDACARILKPGCPFLVYLYYDFENRPIWYRWLWRCSELVRSLVSRAPHRLKLTIAEIVAVLIYWPLARCARLAERALGTNVGHWPLSGYRNLSFYTMRTDSLDRFGTRLEKRFSRSEIRTMLERAGLERITFSNDAPYWCAIGYKKLIAPSSDVP